MDYIIYFAPVFVIPVLYCIYTWGWLKGYEHRQNFEKGLRKCK